MKPDDATAILVVLGGQGEAPTELIACAHGQMCFTFNVLHPPDYWI